MRKFYYLLALLPVLGLAQDRPDLDQLVEAEKKAAAKIMEVSVNANTLNYDVKYHQLEFTLNLDNFINLGNNNYQTSITGVVTTDFKVIEATNTITFDLTDQLVVSTVLYNGNLLPFVQNSSDELVITFPATLAVDSENTVQITYSGIPAGSGFGSFVAKKHSGTPVIWTLSEPFGARDWWPCKQDLNDKVDDGIDVYITAGTQYQAVSNGLEQSVINNGDGTETTHFRHTYPIPAYLIAIAVTNYQVYNQQGGLGTVDSPFFPIVNYSYPENATAIQNSVAVTPAIINFYETKFGPYPFRNEKYGHCQFAWGGGMEHTTVSFMTAGSNGYSRGLIAHEMGHQWFGDKVTCGSWQDIWLNEGFATYLASMVIEQFDGEGAFTTDKGNMINSITSQPGGAVYLTPTEATSVNRIFSSRLSYNKGAMVINMLRFKLGDEAFFQGLQNYLNDSEHAYAYAKTPDLQSHLETASGQDLTEFFNDWVYQQGYPIYDIVANNTAAGQALITINQTQSHNSVDFFEMPVPIRLFGSGGQQTDIVLENTSNGQLFNIDVPFVITSVQFNPKNDIISTDSQAVLANGTFDLGRAISLYPNPASANLTLNVPGSVSVSKTTIYNTLGQIVTQSSTQTSWDVSGFSSGIYMLDVQTNDGNTQLKFVKK